MKTYVQRLTAAYEEKRRQLANDGMTNGGILVLSYEEVWIALRLARDNPALAWGSPWQTRTNAINHTRYSRPRDANRAIRRNAFALARALDRGGA